MERSSGGIISLQALRCFVAIVDLGSVRVAAESVSRSIASLSSQLQRLEDAIGQPLVERGRGRPALTAMGCRVIAIARQMLRQSDDGLEALRSGNSASLSNSDEIISAGNRVNTEIDRLSARSEAIRLVIGRDGHLQLVEPASFESLLTIEWMSTALASWSRIAKLSGKVNLTKLLNEFMQDFVCANVQSTEVLGFVLQRNGTVTRLNILGPSAAYKFQRNAEKLLEQATVLKPTEPEASRIANERYSSPQIYSAVASEWISIDRPIFYRGSSLDIRNPADRRAVLALPVCLESDIPVLLIAEATCGQQKYLLESGMAERVGIIEACWPCPQAELSKLIAAANMQNQRIDH